MMIDRRLSLRSPVSVSQTLGALRNGAGDPCVRIDTSGLWRATRTPDGAATVLLQQQSSQSVRMRAWGDGAEWCADHFEELIGAHRENDVIEDDRFELVARQFQGMRIPRTRALVELAIPIILGQRVTTREAFRSYRGITRALSERAPGPHTGDLMLPPAPDRLAKTPTWWFHRFGVERKRAQAVVEICRRACAVDGLAELNSEEARRRLVAIPGIGLWTAGILGLYGLGDHDSVITGDYHFPNHVAWALAGEVRGDDKRMLELLEPFRGYRGRALRLIIAGFPGAPKFGPRYNPIPIAAL